jgi:hypothetical protein
MSRLSRLNMQPETIGWSDRMATASAVARQGPVGTRRWNAALTRTTG